MFSDDAPPAPTPPRRSLLVEEKILSALICNPSWKPLANYFIEKIKATCADSHQSVDLLSLLISAFLPVLNAEPQMIKPSEANAFTLAWNVLCCITNSWSAQVLLQKQPGPGQHCIPGQRQPRCVQSGSGSVSAPDSEVQSLIHLPPCGELPLSQPL